MIVNGRVDNCNHILSAGNDKNFDIYLNPNGTLEDTWWPSSVSATYANALAAAQSVVNAWGGYNCLKMYYTTDEPSLDRLTKLDLLTQAFRELDPSRQAAPILIGTDRVGPHLNASEPAVLMIDVYPCAWGSSIGDFTMNGYGYPNLDFVSYTRTVVEEQPAPVSTWFILQSHSFGSGGSFSLRQPELEEMRRMFWTAIGEGAKGIFWFIYSTSSDPSQAWLGLKDSQRAEDYTEVGDLAGRILPLRSLLLETQKAPDECFVSGGGYVSTLMSHSGDHFYAVVVNEDCVNSQALTLSSGRFNRIRDLETGTEVSLDTPIVYRPGDGKIYELQTVLDYPPQTPVNLQVSEVTETRIGLQWQPSMEGGQPLGYRIYDAHGMMLDTVEDSFFFHMPLHPDWIYYYQVSAYNNAGESAPSELVYGQTYPAEPPTAPRLLEILSKSAVDVQMQWQVASDNVAVAGYRVFRDGQEVGFTSETVFTDSTVPADTICWYTVLAEDVDGNLSPQASNAACAHTDVMTVDDGLIGHWKFDEADGSLAPDDSGNGHDGTIVGSGWNRTEGVYGGALYFSGGGGDKVDLGGLDVVDSNAMTITAWVLANSFKSGGQDNRIVSKSTGTTTASHYWMLGTYNSGGVKLRFMLKTDGTSHVLTAAEGVIGLDTWVHAAAVYDGHSMILYKDGVEVGRTAKTGVIDEAPSVKALIGSNASDYATWHGRIDDVRLYARALSVAEIENVKNNMAAVAADSTCDQPADLNCDCGVDVLDLSIFSEHWLSGQAKSEGNFDGLGCVDFQDFVVFALEWLIEDSLL
jgi:hypothetical protein